MLTTERQESLITIESDMVDGGKPLEAKVKQRIISDPAFYVSLDEEQLERVTSLEPNFASKELNKTIEEVRLCQESCERELSRRQELRDAYELMKLYQKLRNTDNEANNESSAKRAKQLHLQ